MENVWADEGLLEALFDDRTVFLEFPPRVASAKPARSQREASFARPFSSCVDRSSEAHTAGSRMKYDGSLSLTGSMPCVCAFGTQNALMVSFRIISTQKKTLPPAKSELGDPRSVE